jgi:hypothetical protein
MDMDSSSTHQTLTSDAKVINDLFELIEKQTIQLNEKDKELAENKQQNMVKEQQIKVATVIPIYLYKLKWVQVQVQVPVYYK